VARSCFFAHRQARQPAYGQKKFGAGFWRNTPIADAAETG